MTAKLLVSQLWFARSELVRCIEGVTDEEARKRFEPMNCISWIVGHLADQENRYWVYLAQDKAIIPELKKKVGHGRPPSSPPIDEMWSAWQLITKSSDEYLKTLSPDLLLSYFKVNGKPVRENVGTMLMRNVYHYWFHIGEAYAIRQLLGHSKLPEFVGNMADASYHS